MLKRFLIGLLSCLSAVASAETAHEKGLAIAQEVARRDAGWQDASAKLTMTLRNKHGQQSRRELRIKSLEVADEGDQSLTIFDAPRDIAGTAFLSYTHVLRADDQWLYLPALKRVKRIASANKSGPFVGSEFAYEDLSSAEVKKYRYLWLRDEALGEHLTHVLEEIPVDENSGYTRRVVWLDQTMLQPLKVEFYDRKNALLKTLQMTDYAQYLAQYWRPGQMQMQNHQTGKSTELRWENYQFRSGMTAHDFDQNTLKRAR